jgi:hypothetical protein
MKYSSMGFLNSLPTKLSSEQYGHLGCNAMQFFGSEKFRKNILIPLSGPKRKPSKKAAEASSKLYIFSDLKSLSRN